MATTESLPPFLSCEIGTVDFGRRRTFPKKSDAEDRRKLEAKVFSRRKRLDEREKSLRELWKLWNAVPDADTLTDSADIFLVFFTSSALLSIQRSGLGITRNTRGDFAPHVRNNTKCCPLYRGTAIITKSTLFEYEMSELPRVLNKFRSFQWEYLKIFFDVYRLSLSFFL